MRVEKVQVSLDERGCGGGIGRKRGAFGGILIEVRVQSF